MLGIKKKKNKSEICYICGKPSGVYYICNDCIKNSQQETDKKCITTKEKKV